MAADDITLVEKPGKVPAVAPPTSGSGGGEVVKVKVNTMNNGAQTSSAPQKVSSQIAAKNKEKEQGNKETSLAFIMMVYVLVFLLCHSPKLLLNLHEITTIR